MYGLIGKMIAVPGERDALLKILLESVGEMPGCLSYVVARDPKNDDAIWITEVWSDEASHKASLAIPAVRAAITRAKPLIQSFSDHHVTEPVGGHGLPRSNKRVATAADCAAKTPRFFPTVARGPPGPGPGV
ncbi:MAG TPA: putative quinol monooxygenase [Polyangia bacterium]